jgi:hypothetical protein
MKLKTSELTGAALDWAVAKAEGVDGYIVNESFMTRWTDDECEDGVDYHYSTAWAQGGPIIEREGIALDCLRTCFVIDSWVAASEMVREGDYDSPVIKFTGPTPLIAAMRCYVASEMGEEVEVPDELQGEIA